MDTEEEKQTASLENIQESTEASAAVLLKFSNVFSSIDATLMDHSRLMREMLRINTEQFEIEQRREQLASVSGAPSVVVEEPIREKESKSDKDESLLRWGPLSGLISNALGSLFGNLFGNSGLLNGAALAASVAGSKVIKVGAIAGIIAPWLSNFVGDTIESALKDTDWSEESKATAKEIGKDATFRGAIGSAFGPKGALIGAVSAFTSQATDFMLTQLGIDEEALKEKSLNLFGVEVNAAQMKPIVDVGITAALTAFAPKLFSMISGPVIAAIGGFITSPFLIPVIGAAAVGALGVWLYNWSKKNEDRIAEETAANIKTQTDNNFHNRGILEGANKKWNNFFNAKTGDGSTAMQNLANLRTSSEGNSDMTDEQKSSQFDALSELVSKAGGDITVPDPDVPASAMDDIIAILKAIGKKQLADAWERVRRGNQGRLQAEANRAILADIQNSMANDAILNNPNTSDIQKERQRRKYQMQIDSLQGNLEASGWGDSSLDTSVVLPEPTPPSAIPEDARPKLLELPTGEIISVPKRANDVSEVNKAGSTAGGAGAVMIRQGDNIFNSSTNPAYVNSNVNQAVSHYGMAGHGGYGPGYDTPGGIGH